MKNLILVLAAVLCAQSALAQSDDYNEVVMPIPAPEGEMELDRLKELKVTDEAQFTTYLQSRDFGGKGDLYSLPTSGSQVSCSLTVAEVELSNFKVLKKEYPARLGARFFVSPKKSITLKQTMSSVGVEAVKPSCNGEPELCDGQVYYQYRTTILLTDKASNQWNLNCVSPFSRELYASDVKINGLKIK